MSFLDEGTFVGRNAVDDAIKDPEFKALRSDEKQKAIAKLKAGGSVTTEKKSKKRPDYADVDGDGDRDEPMAKAFNDKKNVKEGIMSELELLAQESSTVEEFLQNVYQDYPQHEGNAKIEEYLINFYNQSNSLGEGKLSKTLGGAAVLVTLLGLNKATSEALYNGDPKIKDLTTQYEKAKKDGNKEDMARFEKEIKDRETQIDVGKFQANEAKTVELPTDTTFTLDLKHLMQKHLDEGKSQEDVVKLTKALMKKLHDKGEVKVNGTKVVFKENKTNEASIMGIPLESFADYYTALDLAKNIGVPVVAFSALLAIMGVKKATEFLKKGKEAVMAWYEQNKLNEQEETQLALPEPDAPDFLGDDGVDYEGGMAKSQMLKMKKYAAALCDMVDDESQLEAWVQAKITKASDYMSAVYHYLDYQKSKMDEGYEGEFKPLTQQEKDTLVKIGKLEKSELAAYEKFLKDNPDLPNNMTKAIKAFRAKK